MKIGLFGGTFNPIHIGHLVIASKVLEIFDLGKVIFVPSGNPPHKRKVDIIDASHRLKMIQLAVKNYKRFEISDIEIKRKGKSYTLDTIKQMKKSYKNITDIYFIAGADSALDLHNWKKPSEILASAHFLAVTRPGFSLRKLEEKYAGKITTVEGISINVSSSDIRRRVKEGLTIKKLVPGDVERYIKNNHLYI